MAWQQWLVAAIIFLSTLASIAVVGKPREPLSPGSLVFIAAINTALIALVLSI